MVVGATPLPEILG